MSRASERSRTARGLTRSVLLAIAALSVGPSSLGACRATPAPSPIAQPSATPRSRVIDTPQPSQGPATATATHLHTETPGNWVSYEGELFTIRVPRGWEAVQQTDENAQAAFAAFQQANPDLAASIGGAESLPTVTLRASDPKSRGTAFSDNLNIRRVELGSEAIVNLAETAEVIAAQYRQLGSDVQEIRAGVAAGRLPAARIVYAFPVTGASDRVIPAEGMQYLIVTPTDLWILTYTAARDRFTELESVFEESAQSFGVK